MPYNTKYIIIIVNI